MLQLWVSLGDATSSGVLPKICLSKQVYGLKRKGLGSGEAGDKTGDAASVSGSRIKFFTCEMQTSFFHRQLSICFWKSH